MHTSPPALYSVLDPQLNSAALCRETGELGKGGGYRGLQRLCSAVQLCAKTKFSDLNRATTANQIFTMIFDDES